MYNIKQILHFESKRKFTPNNNQHYRENVMKMWIWNAWRSDKYLNLKRLKVIAKMWIWSVWRL